MEVVVLSNIIKTLESGSREKGGSINSGIISIGGTHLSTNGGFKWDKKEFISEYFFQEMRSGKIKTNDILVVKDGATSGKVSFVDTNFPYKNAAINEHLFRLQINQQIANPKYIFYFLYSKYGKEQILSDFRGATIGGISRGFINKVNVPLPDLETQNKIVAILDKVQTIINKRTETIQKYDELLRATFIDMFGNPMERPSRWKIDKMAQCLINVTAGQSYPGENKKALEEDELGVLKISAVTKGFFNPNEYKAIKKSNIRQTPIFPKKGDLLFSRANTLELVGATCIVDKDYEYLFLPDKIWKIETDENFIKKTYLHYVLQNKDVRKTFLSIATGSSGSMRNISMEKFKNIIIPYPPLELQNKFETLYLKYIKIQTELISSNQSLNNLLNALSQLAFKGELQFGQAVALEVLLENDYAFFKEKSDKKSIQQLLKRLDKNELNEYKFYDSVIYDKAKSFIFELLKEDKIEQFFDDKTNTIKMKLK